MKSIFSGKSQVVLITIINVLLVGYLGWVVWDLKHPQANVIAPSPVIEEKKKNDYSEWITSLLSDIPATARFDAMSKIVPGYSLEDIRPLSTCLDLSWSGYRTMTDYQKIQWLAQVNRLFMSVPDGDKILMPAMVSLVFNKSALPLLRNHAYFIVCTLAINSSQQAAQPANTKSEEDRANVDREVESYVALYKSTTEMLENEQTQAYLPLIIQSKAFFIKQRSKEFDQKAFEKECVALVNRFPNDERVTKEVLKALNGLQSSILIDYAIKLMTVSSSEAVIQHALGYLSGQNTEKVRSALEKKRFIYADLEEERLRILESFKAK